MSADNSQHYQRVIIQGTLTNNSDLHIGSGETRTADEGEQTRVNSFLIDADGLPYIPGSTLRGYLRSLLKPDSDGQSQRKHWFGDGRQHSDSDIQGTMGMLRIYDARLSSIDTLQLNQHSRTSIDAVTASAKRHHLSTHETVATGNTFAVRIEMDTLPEGDSITSDVIHQLLGLLDRLNHAQIGKGKSTGQGQMSWELTDPDGLSGLSDKDFFSWLNNNRLQPLDKFIKPLELSALSPDDLQNQQWTEESFAIRADSPLLINDSHHPDITEKQISHVFMYRNDNQAFIPASTLKGWFRAHCRRILMTIGLNQPDADYNDTQTRVDGALDRLFGGTDTGASLVRFYDATVAFTPAEKHSQTFNAVDRFTGGVKDNALYSVTALHPGKPFESRIAWQKDKLKGWMQLLLMYCWRDAEEGDLVLGWGKSKGYGQLMLLSEHGGWKRWLAGTPQETLAEWEQELTEVLTVGQQTGKEQAA